MIRAVAPLVLTVLLVGCSDARDDTATNDAAPGTTSSPAAAEERRLAYVALGASWQYGAHCGMCETFVSYYATYVEEATGLPVDFDNRSTNGGGTADFLATLREDEAARESVAQADIVLIGGGTNDLDRTGALEKVVAGTCGGEDGSRCLRAMARVWRRGFDAILDEVDELTAGRDVAVRLVGDQNVFLSDTSIIRDYGLPADFALDGGELLIREQSDAMAKVAQQHGAEFVDVWRIFNGPAHDQPWDENSPEAHQAVARALLDTGLAPLDLN